MLISPHASTPKTIFAAFRAVTLKQSMASRRSTEASAVADAQSQLMLEKFRHIRQCTRKNKLFQTIFTIVQKFIIYVLSAGPIPNHIAFIMDGNRRYEKKHNLQPCEGHIHGLSALMSMLRHCYALGVKYVTVYAFSIDNFKRPPAEVTLLMNLMRQTIDDLLEGQSVIFEYGIRIYFVGNLTLLEESLRLAAEKAMRATAGGSNATLMICVAYTSTNEILHSVEESCRCLLANSQKGHELVEVKSSDIERNLYVSIVPDPDVLIRSSGKTRLSNFLLWQTGKTVLHAPRVLWPEIGVRALCWSVINFQRSWSYVVKKPKQDC